MPGTLRAHPTARGPDRGHGLDSHWDRKFQAGSIEPDFTLDLHGHTLNSAHARLDDGLMQAKAMGARVVLLIAGKPRPVDAADRGSKRGAIRAKVLDWLAIGPHGADIAAIRNAHRRHGGEGALYLILKRRR
jgi:DNA-nicking Smr family endonuclease